MKLSESGKHRDWQFALWIQNCYENEQKNSLTIYFGPYYWWFNLKKQWIAPIKKWVDTSHYDWAKPDADGKCGYTSYTRKKYGFNISKESLHLYFGVDTDSWPNPYQIYYSFPWYEQRRLYVDYIDEGTTVVRYYDKPNGAIDFDSMRAAEELTPKKKFKLIDFDGETEVIATIYETVSIYRQGTKWAKFIGHLLPKKIYRSIHVDYDKETGTERGSWKGGTTGYTSPILDGESLVDAFYRKSFNDGFVSVAPIHEK